MRAGRLGMRGALAALVLFAGAIFADPGAALNALAAFGPAPVVVNAAYGPSPRQRLDAYPPAGGVTKAPVIVFFYGGSWSSGAKEEFRLLASALAARGLAVVTPDYGLYPAARFPAFLEDGARAARWAKDNAARFGGDPERLFLMGHSAGAHIAAMLALDARWLAAVGMTPKRDLLGAIGLAGPYRFALDTELLRGVFGAVEEAATQPVNFVSPDAPPMLLLTGAEDATVRPRNATELAARLRAAGASATLAVYPRVGHLGLIGALSPALRFLAPVLDDICAFVATASTPAAPGVKDE